MRPTIACNKNWNPIWGHVDEYGSFGGEEFKSKNYVLGDIYGYYIYTGYNK